MCEKNRVCIRMKVLGTSQESAVTGESYNSVVVE